MGVWLEIVTLLIPGFNDSPDEIDRLTRFVAVCRRDIPWHVTAFHKDYRMSDPENTTPEMLVRAAEIAKAERLRYVYAGQYARAAWDPREHALPPVPRAAHRALRVSRAALSPDARADSARSARTSIPGRWATEFGGQITERPFLPR